MSRTGSRDLKKISLFKVAFWSKSLLSMRARLSGVHLSMIASIQIPIKSK